MDHDVSDEAFADPGPVEKRVRVLGNAERPFLVYHARDMDMMRATYAAIHGAGAWQEAGRQNFGPGAPYYLVAVVIARGLEEVFEITNNGTNEAGPWWYNQPHIWKCCLGGPRSTSIGDVVVDPTTGRVAICASTGWSEILPGGVLGGKIQKAE